MDTLFVNRMNCLQQRWSESYFLYHSVYFKSMHKEIRFSLSNWKDVSSICKYLQSSLCDFAVSESKNQNDDF